MKFSFAADPKPLQSAEHLLVLAPKKAFGPRSRLRPTFAKLFDDDRAEILLQLGKEANVGLLGGTASSRHGKSRLTVGVLPDRVSRHATATRAESIRKLTAAAGLGSGRHAVVALLDDDAHLLAVSNAVSRALPDFTRKSLDPRAGSVTLACADRDGRLLKADAATRDVVLRSREAMRFVDMPPTDLDPAVFAREAKKLLRKLPGVKVSEIVGPALLQKKLGGVHAVGRCAKSAPRVLIATANASSKARSVALIGKGITYDTGGLHLKGRGAMETMKADMGGAAAVLGAFLALHISAECHQRVCAVFLPWCPAAGY
ncbi:MAG TPA: hypothetical protein ENI87_01335 [bacterium]|nr:hypothetical protein [bacterium]